MKWRTLLAIVAGLLLAVPLALAMGSVLYPVHAPPSRSDVRVSPVLSYGEYRELLTYGKACRGQADCESPLGCLQINPGDASYCLASECMTDVQCPDGFACRSFTTLNSGPMIRFCAPIGPQQEGHPCMQGLGVNTFACAQGLRCAGWCGRPCELDAPATCPEGFFCGKGPEGPSCLPTCEGRTCPEGQQCIRFEGGTSVCAAVRGQDCQQTPCAEGFECRRHFPRTGAQGLVVGMECVQPCGEGAACPEGLVCSHGECRRSCEPDTLGACGPDEACKQGSATEQQGVCRLRTKP